MSIRIAPPTLGLEAVRGIEADVAFAAGNDRKESLYLWDDNLQQLQQITDTNFRSLCFPNWQPEKASPVKAVNP